jgi:tRNA threonylcarbamoyladenosine biosynthesis protein TsaE
VSLDESRVLKDIKELSAFASTLAKEIEAGKTLVLLSGPMGSGKTQLTKFILAALGDAGDEAASPTFAIHNSYRTSRGDLEHFDLFRLDTEDDLESTGFWDIVSAAKGIVIIEWANRLFELKLQSQLPSTCLRIDIDIDFLPESNDSRRLVIQRVMPVSLRP